MNRLDGVSYRYTLLNSPLSIQFSSLQRSPDQVIRYLGFIELIGKIALWFLACANDDGIYLEKLGFSLMMETEPLLGNAKIFNPAPKFDPIAFQYRAMNPPGGFPQ